jgi:hypothetical protein
MKTLLGWENSTTHGIVATHGTMQMGQHQIKLQGQFQCFRKKVP